ncbi:sigma-70 family RNA polymerase sigma factor [Alicyclobacillus tolerans]|uniref:sigma-70 family RNA polymerase sigma factor n=1 Tax=Alicyclobacillus tolerans TaxID=90970 RepID=UPI003B7D62CE
MDDNEQTALIAWQAGDSTGAEFLLQKYEKLVWKLANKYRHTSLEDAVQEARYALLVAAKAYRSTGGASLLTYLYRSIHGHLRNIMRREWKHEAHCQPRSTEEWLFHWTIDPSAEQTTERFLLRHDMEQWIHNARLSPREKEAMRAVFEDQSLQDLARQHGVSKETCKIWRKRAVQKLRKTYNL